MGDPKKKKEKQGLAAVNDSASEVKNEAPETQREDTNETQTTSPLENKVKELEEFISKLKTENIENRLKKKEAQKAKDEALLKNQEFKALSESLTEQLKSFDDLKTELQKKTEYATKYEELIAKRDAEVMTQAKKISEAERAILSDLSTVEAKENFLKIILNKSEAKASPSLNYSGTAAAKASEKPKVKSLY